MLTAACWTAAGEVVVCRRRGQMSPAKIIPGVLVSAVLFLGLPACHGAPDEPVLTVNSRQALLEIPIPEHDTWTWYRPETRANYLEYQFDATVSVADTPYSFGFYLFKLGGRMTDSGPLSELLRFGQNTVFRDNHAISGIWVRPELDVSGLLRVRLLDSEVVSMMFAQRPEVAQVRVKMPGVDPESTLVSIRYTGR
jgi:hypothetical protein